MNPNESSPNSGELIVGADWAIAHGDLGTLANLVGLLAGQVDEFLRRDLIDLANLCSLDPDRATLRWSQLREQVVHEFR